MASALEDLLTRRIEDGTIPGAVALLGAGEEVELVAAGSAAIGGPPLRPDAIVRIQSMTKAISAVAALRLVEAGQLTLDDPIDRWLPELADRPVLVRPDAALDDTEPSIRPITLRHLLTNTSGYGMALAASPLQDAMRANGTEAGPEPPSLGADEWLARLAELPLTFQPGAGWRYHHSFSVLGILIARIVGRPLHDHLVDDVFGTLGMIDTGMYVPTDKLDRLPAAFRHSDGELVEIEPAGGGFYAGAPPFDVSHGELVSTAADYHRFLRALTPAADAAPPLIAADHLHAMTTDQVPNSAKTPDDFFPGFWDSSGWGFGVGVVTSGTHVGRYGWAGGQGTDFFVDQDGRMGLLLTQVELGEELGPLIEEFQEL